ncbi:MAG: glutathione S-transferase family protein [Chloroflexota bacterium]
MPILLYDLVGIDDRRFSPACWRTRMALAHKGLEVETIPTRFTEIAAICDAEQKTVPVLDDNGTIVVDSWAIAQYLEETYPDKPSLFGGTSGSALTRFYDQWANTVLSRGLFNLVILDIYNHLTPEDKNYFRTSREKRIGRTLEEFQAGREDRLKGFRNSLFPLRFTVKEQPFLGGDQPLYADYLLFGGFQWARVVSDFALVEADDPVNGWFQRCLDLHDGLGRNALGYNW